MDVNGILHYHGHMLESHGNDWFVYMGSQWALFMPSLEHDPLRTHLGKFAIHVGIMLKPLWIGDCR